jgi:hypothetical protein
MSDTPEGGERQPPQVCCTCGAPAFMGISGTPLRWYCPQHMPGLPDGERADWRRVLATPAQPSGAGRTILPGTCGRAPGAHHCPVCGEWGAFGYGPPGWPLPERWYCREHRGVAERQQHRLQWEE